MQKKVLALAVASLLSGAAFAQTAVTFGGSIATDVGFYSDASKDGIKGKSAVDDSNWQGSRIWWKAQEDLGNGLKVEAYQELRPRTDWRDSIVNRRSYLQIGSANIGTLKLLGGFGNVLDDVLTLSEAKSADWGKGVINPLLTGAGSVNGVGANNDTLYNSVQYISPTFSGFALKLSLSTHDKNQNELDGNGDINIRAYGFNGTYINGPVKVGLAHLTKSRDGDKLKETMLSGMYDFGMFQLGAAYSASKNSNLSEYAWGLYNDGALIGAASSDWRKKGWRINLGADITSNDHIGLSYSQAKVDFANNYGNEKVSGVGLSYTHMLSKRTTFLAEYAAISMDEDKALLAQNYQKLLRVGIRHDF